MVECAKLAQHLFGLSHFFGRQSLVLRLFLSPPFVFNGALVCCAGRRGRGAAAAARGVDHAARGVRRDAQHAVFLTRLSPSQVVDASAGALEDVVRLYHPDPGGNPPVRARRLLEESNEAEKRAERRPQVTDATHKRLTGRAAVALRGAHARLAGVASAVRFTNRCLPLCALLRSPAPTHTPACVTYALCPSVRRDAPRRRAPRLLLVVALRRPVSRDVAA